MGRGRAKTTVTFNLTAGRSGLAENNAASNAASFSVDAQSDEFTPALMEAAGKAYLAAIGVTGNVSNGRVIADGVTADDTGKIAKRKGRVKIVSESYTGDIWIRDTKSESRKARAGQVAALQAQLAEMQAKLVAAGIA